MSSLPLPYAAEAPRRRGWLALLLLLALATAVVGAWLGSAPAPRSASAGSAAAIASARARALASAHARGLAAAVLEAVPQNALPPRVAPAPLAAELFAAHSWYVPPPPPPPAPPPRLLPPPPPMAPPLPFTFIGSYTPEGDATVYFVTRADRVYDLRVGDVLDDRYALAAASAAQLTFNYLPLNQPQLLAIGATP